MIQNRLVNYCTIFVLSLIVSIGLPSALPLLSSPHGFAAEIYRKEQVNTPEIKRYYVATTGDGSDGSSWEKAFQNLQYALLWVAGKGGGEIWVAKGVYYADYFVVFPDPRVATFEIENNISLYGGFDTKDTKFSDRDWEKNVTVISGDLDRNDFTDANGVVVDTGNINGGNAYHVVTAVDVNSSVVVDGFTITAGSADGAEDGQSFGGGLYCESSGSSNACNLRLINITFAGNYTLWYGGAMSNISNNSGNCSPELDNVTFSGNFAGENGGAIINVSDNSGNSSPELNNVTFSGNFADEHGGAIMNDSNNSGNSSPILTNVTFSNNLTNQDGGAISNRSRSLGNSNPILTNVTFSGNDAVLGGGAVSNIASDNGTSSPILTNVVFSGNRSSDTGGAMLNLGHSGECSPILTNVTFSGNKAGTKGGAIYNSAISDGTSNPQMRNSILWNNKDSQGTGVKSAAIFNDNNARTYLVNSIVQGVGSSGDSWTQDKSFVDGGGNFDSNPMFITPINPSKAPTTKGNLRLESESPAVDSGDNAFVIDIPSDLDSAPRIIDGDMDGTPKVDMGAYEYQIPYIYNEYIPFIIR